MSKHRVDKLASNGGPVFTMGSRKPADRSLMLRLAAIGVVATLGYGGIKAAETSHFNEMLASSAPQATTARIIGKVTHLGGQQLGDFIDPQDTTWQSLKDAPNAHRQLVLAIDGEKAPVAIAVSQKVFDTYCQPHADQTSRRPRSDTNRVETTCADPKLAKVFGADSFEPLQISYTRNRLDGSLQITEVEGMTQRTTSLAEKVRLRREFKAQSGKLESATYSADTGIIRGPGPK